MLIELKNGRRTKVPDQAGRALVKLGRAIEVQEAQAQAGYSTRMMQAVAPAASNAAAPYGYKADGTPRKRPAPAPRKAGA
jgi:hypothetical protein